MDIAALLYDDLHPDEVVVNIDGRSQVASPPAQIKTLAIDAVVTFLGEGISRCCFIDERAWF